jgi:hypothetical protein
MSYRGAGCQPPRHLPEHETALVSTGRRRTAKVRRAAHKVTSDSNVRTIQNLATLHPSGGRGAREPGPVPERRLTWKSCITICSQEFPESLLQDTCATVVDFVMVWYSAITKDHQTSTTSERCVIEIKGVASSTLEPRTWVPEPDSARYKNLLKFIVCN